MSENSIKSIMDVTMDKLRAMVDANTIIGDPIVVGDVTLLPVSKVSFGLATGGSDFPSKTQSGLYEKNCRACYYMYDYFIAGKCRFIVCQSGGGNKRRYRRSFVRSKRRYAPADGKHHQNNDIAPALRAWQFEKRNNRNGGYAASRGLFNGAAAG